MTFRKSSLSEHKLKKKQGKFVSPMNDAIGDKLQLCPWIDERLPEFFWLGVILKQYERKEGLKKVKLIVDKLHDIDENMLVPAFSKILAMNEENQEKFFKYIIKITNKDILNSLSLLYSYSEYPVFSKILSNPMKCFTERNILLAEVLKEISNHQSNLSTDIRFIVVYFTIITGKYHVPKEMIDSLNLYSQIDHDNIEMRHIRPMIRASEMTSQMILEHNQAFCKEFWKQVSMISDCDLFMLNYKPNSTDLTSYIKTLNNIFEYFISCYTATDQLNKKFEVILGIGTYSLKIFKEIYEHKLENSLIGRSSVRILIENYIMLKFLIHKEQENSGVWKEYQEYGLGAFKKIIAHLREMPKPNLSHVNYEYIELLINEHKDEIFQDIDLNYFGGDMRKKAEIINEKSLWALCYQYGSSYSHGLWGAIRESCMLGCKNPSHHSHCIPDYESKQKLPSILKDSIVLLNKTIMLVNNFYEIPEKLYEGLIKFE